MLAEKLLRPPEGNNVYQLALQLQMQLILIMSSVRSIQLIYSKPIPCYFVGYNMPQTLF